MLAYNLGNFLRALAMPKAAAPWSLTSLRERRGQSAAGDRGRGMPRCRPISVCQPPGARKGTLRSSFAPTRHDLPLPKPFRGAILASKPPGIWRMSVQTMPELTAAQWVQVASVFISALLAMIVGILLDSSKRHRDTVKERWLMPRLQVLFNNAEPGCRIDTNLYFITETNVLAGTQPVQSYVRLKI
jgi:hypothetical protein